MRIKGIRGDDAETPNELIRACASDVEKRGVLMKLRICWNRYDRRLAIYDGNGSIIGIAFADDDGTIRDIASPHDLTRAMPAMSDAVRNTVASRRTGTLRRTDAATTTDGARAGAPQAPRRHSRVQPGDMPTAGRTSGDMRRYDAADDGECDDDDYEVSDGFSEPAVGIPDGRHAVGVQPPVAARGKADGGKGRHAGAVVTVIVVVAAIASVCAMLAWHVGPLADANLPLVGNVPSIVESLRDRYANGTDGSTGGNGSGHAQIADGQETTVTISYGDTISDVVSELREAGLPDQAEGVYKAMDASGTLSQIQPGSYHFKGGESAETIATRIASGQLYPDGYLGVDAGTTIRTLTQKVSSGKFPFSADDFSAAMGNPQAYKSDYRMLGAIPDGLPSLEGFVPAGTYDLSGCKTADEAVRKLLDAGERRFESSGMDASTWFRTLTEASMLDKEIMYDSERQTVASVIDNRLAQDMPLQIDATVLYALGRDTGIPSLSDINVDSPYNTYKNKGLPIGPICSGISQTSIDAVTNHPQTQYLYYCLAPNNDGHHVFATTYEEHQKNQEAYEAATGAATGTTTGTDGTSATQ